MKKVFAWLTILLVAAMLLSSCAAANPAAPTEPAAEAPAATEAPAEPEAPAEEPAAAEAPAATEAPAQAAAPAEQGELVLATTTSTDDSGLLEYLLPLFTEETGITVNVIAVGTGQALTLGQDGNADVLLVHARAKEDEFMAAGHGLRREEVMYNDFILVGPESDPAGIQGMTSAVDAFKQLAETESTFISRGDESGTHTKELGIWTKAEIEPAGDWYVAAGQGMGEVLTMASEQLGYTLSDRATYLARSKEGLDLVILVEGDEALFNPYGVIAVNPDKGEHIKIDLAQTFIDWIISVPVQEKIAGFGVEEFGQSLFIPDSAAWNEAQGGEASAETGGEAALKVTGLVAEEVSWTDAELKAMETKDVESTNKDGETKSYTGVSLNSLLEAAGVDAGAAKLVFVADDGFTAEVALSEVQACTDCIVSFRSQGGYSIVLPDFESNLQVKGVVEIQIQ